MWKRITGMSGIILSCILLSGCVEDSSEGKSTAGNTVTAFIQGAANSASVWKGWGAGRLYEDTGLTLELAFSGSQVEEKLRQDMLSGTIPDIIGFQNLNEAALYMDAGLLLPLNEYEEYLQAVFTEEDYEDALAYSREHLSNGTGELYLLPVSVGQADEQDYMNIPLLWWSAYEKAGLPEVNTLEDYLDVVERMLARQPINYMGEKMFGFSLYQDEEGMAVHAADLAYLYGIDLYTVSPLMEADMTAESIGSIFREDSFYRRMLAFYHEANQRGLLDGDSANQTYSNLAKKISAARVMAVWNSKLTEGSSDAQLMQNRQPGYEAVPAGDMKLYREADSAVGRNRYYAVCRETDNVQDACRLLNWLYEEDTQFYLYNGPEGVLWEYDAANVPCVTESGKVYTGNSNIELDGYSGTLGDGTKPFQGLGRSAASLTRDGYALCYKYWSSGAEEAYDSGVCEYYGHPTLQAYLEANDMIADGTAAVYMLEAVPVDINKKVREIRDMADELSWQMIYAQDGEEFEALWQRMVIQAEELGMMEVEKYYRGAWEEALELAAEWNEAEEGTTDE